jgi:hypothetical protein
MLLVVVVKHGWRGSAIGYPLGFFSGKRVDLPAAAGRSLRTYTEKVSESTPCNPHPRWT